MLNVPGPLKVFLCLEPADMRRSFDGLASMVEHVMRKNPLSGNLFVFRNKRADRVKLLYWEGDGLATVRADVRTGPALGGLPK